MASENGVGSHLRSFWENFFPLTLYFIVFLGIATLFLQLDHFIRFLLTESLVRFTRTQAYLTLEQLQLVKLVPFGVAYALLLSIYLFERAVIIVGSLVPPFPVWSGSPALFVDQYCLQELWCLMPKATSITALDLEARRILNRAELEGKTLPTNGLSQLGRRSNSARRMLLYAKAGVVWSWLTFFVSMLMGRFAVTNVGIVLFASIAFTALGAIAILLQAELLVQTSAETMRTAVAVLQAYDAPLDPGGERRMKFERVLRDSRYFAPRFLGLRWLPRVNLDLLRSVLPGLTS